MLPPVLPQVVVVNKEASRPQVRAVKVAADSKVTKAVKVVVARTVMADAKVVREGMAVKVAKPGRTSHAMVATALRASSTSAPHPCHSARLNLLKVSSNSR